eukprot:6176616-Pleurochrysis_carterae.AAC.1
MLELETRVAQRTEVGTAEDHQIPWAHAQSELRACRKRASREGEQKARQRQEKAESTQAARVRRKQASSQGVKMLEVRGVQRVHACVRRRRAL